MSARSSLELPGDFWLHVAIAGMEPGEFVFAGVDLSEDELFFVKSCQRSRGRRGSSSAFRIAQPQRCVVPLHLLRPRAQTSTFPATSPKTTSCIV